MNQDALRVIREQEWDSYKHTFTTERIGRDRDSKMIYTAVHITPKLAEECEIALPPEFGSDDAIVVITFWDIREHKRHRSYVALRQGDEQIKIADFPVA